MDKSQPLGLPKGSVRAILTLLIVVVAAAMLFIPTTPGANTVKGIFVGLAFLSVKEYFDIRKLAAPEDDPAPEAFAIPD